MFRLQGIGISKDFDGKLLVLLVLVVGVKKYREVDASIASNVKEGIQVNTTSYQQRFLSIHCTFMESLYANP